MWCFQVYLRGSRGNVWRTDANLIASKNMCLNLPLLIRLYLWTRLPVLHMVSIFIFRTIYSTTRKAITHLHTQTNSSAFVESSLAEMGWLHLARNTHWLVTLTYVRSFWILRLQEIATEKGKFGMTSLKLILQMCLKKRGMPCNSALSWSMHCVTHPFFRRSSIIWLT